MNRIVKIGINALATCAFIALGIVLYDMYQNYTHEQQHVKELEQQLSELSKKEKQSAVMQSINAQMEEIANQERIISEEQRIEAVEQSKIANEMRQHAEIERQNAQEAEKRALTASELAKKQQTIAEKERVLAEYSKSVADTLSYVAMARTVGNAAITQQSTGNRDLAALLAYASYIFTKRYKGDLYHPSIYEALTRTSGGQQRWSVARGGIIKMNGIPGTNSFMSISMYGEIQQHTKTANGLQTQTVFSDKAFDFRDIYINPERTFFAVSHTGHLVAKKENGKVHIINIDGAVRPFRIFSFKSNELMVTAEQSVHVIDAITLRPIRTIPLPFKTSIAGNKGNQLALFDQVGNMYLADKGLTRFHRENLPFKGRITSYNYSKSTGITAFGMYDGTIYYINSAGKMYKLVGHNSRITRIIYDNQHLYSCSYDGTVRYWNIVSEKVEPISILTSRQWLVCISFDKRRKNIWSAEYNGTLTETLINIPEMAQKLKAKIKRNLTREEWNYYIGRNIPYETFIGKEASL